jgi:hypothetical protein
MWALLRIGVIVASAKNRGDRSLPLWVATAFASGAKTAHSCQLNLPLFDGIACSQFFLRELTIFKQLCSKLLWQTRLLENCVIAVCLDLILLPTGKRTSVIGLSQIS